MKSFESFNELSLPASLAQALEKMKFLKPTPIQSTAIPVALEGKDILGTAQTGTGKTGAFAVPMLTHLFADRGRQALILVPTRELAAQVHAVLSQMGRGMRLEGTLVVGGESFRRQADKLYRNTDYIVATPGRLNDHLQEGTADLSYVEFLVLDEVDRMLDMGFMPQIKKILTHLPPTRQTLLFSATLPPEITGLANSFLKQPERISVGAVGGETKPLQITEKTIRTTDEGKKDIILAEVNARQGKVLVFARTQSRTDRLAGLLYKKGHDVVSLHGGLSQGQRKRALERFRSGASRIMVATDLAGRGIDVNDIEHVINYDLPSNREDYIHRIGRTGRFGKKGDAVNLLSANDFEGERIISGKKGPARSFKPSFRSKQRRSFRGSR